ncbi:MAG: response regulator [Chloroflexi bacterium]|nr:response regulator [Chloroflexota bacterium]
MTSEAPAPEQNQRAFLANLRHELRTPINAILGYSEMLIEDAQDQQDQRLCAELEKIRAAGTLLLTCVNETLDANKIGAGKFDADLETFAANFRYALRTPLSSVIGYAEMLLEDAEVQNRESLRGDLEKIHAASERFLAFINDIANFPTTQKQQPAIDRTEAAAIIQDVVSTIQPIADDKETNIERGSVLVVDDNDINRDVLTRRLTRQGHTVATANNGRHALDLIAREKFDLILLDLMMPEMNGFQVLEHLKADPNLREIPVLMISALDEIDSVVRCIEMGAEDYLPKPFNPVLLKARIGACLEKKRLRDRQRELFGKFATKEVADELITHGFSLGGKLVHATAMFSDIRSFTTIAESQTPAKTIELLNGYFSHMIDAIGKEGGIVNQMVGDGLMAIFGAPLPHDDHRERAVRAALNMLDRINDFNRAYASDPATRIRIGIGIASGEVIAGFTGTEARATYTCVGDTVNLAARLESHTKVVGKPILIDEATKLGLSDGFPIAEEGTVQLKGKTVPVHVYSVLRERRQAKRD